MAKTIFIAVVSVFTLASCTSLYLAKPQDPKCWDKNHPRYDSKKCNEESPVVVEFKTPVENKKTVRTKRSVASKRLEGRHFTEEELKQRRSQQKTHRFEPTTIGLKVGMTNGVVVNEIGNPEKINRTITKWGIHEQWCYHGYGKDFYLYFDDRVLTGIQE